MVQGDKRLISPCDDGVQTSSPDQRVRIGCINHSGFFIFISGTKHERSRPKGSWYLGRPNKLGCAVIRSERQINRSQTRTRQLSTACSANNPYLGPRSQTCRPLLPPLRKPRRTLTLHLNTSPLSPHPTSHMLKTLSAVLES